MALRSMIFAIAAIAILTACDEQNGHQASLRIDDTTSGNLYWFDKRDDKLIVLLTDSSDGRVPALATALAWPDRQVLTIASPPTAGSPRGCDAFLQDAANAVARFHARSIARGQLRIIVGLNSASAAAIAIATAAHASAGAVVASGYCPPSGDRSDLGFPAFCSGNENKSGSGTKSATPLVVIPDSSRCTRDDLAATLASFTDGRAVNPVGGEINLLTTVVSQVIGSKSSDIAADLGLPLIEMPASGRNKRLAIIYSGDGGWADIDRQLGEELSKRGVAVVGFDTLKYFWRRKEPVVAAAALDLVVSHYRQKWSADDVVLIGYSFGADILPLLWPSLAPDTRAAISHVALLGLGSDASLEITVGGWVGVTAEHSLPTLPAVQKISGPRVLCIFGEEETDDPCPQLASSGVTAIATPGDHHFDGNYKKLADMILSNLRN